jgi:hypothetical protein
MNLDTEHATTNEQQSDAKDADADTRTKALVGKAPGMSSGPAGDETLLGNGKIARLPHKIRERLNRKLRDGQKGPVLLEWLNALPQVKKVLREQFGGKPIAKNNLSRWVQKGYRAWLSKQEAFEQVRQSLEEAEQFEDSGPADLTERVATWLCMRLAQETQKLGEAGANADLSVLSRLCRSITSLRRGDHSVRRLGLEEARLELERQTRAGSKQMEKLFWEWTQRPDIKEKLYGKPLSDEEVCQRYMKEFGVKHNPYAKTPGFMAPEQRLKFESQGTKAQSQDESLPEL